MVISHASIATSTETIDKFFSPLKSDIEMIRAQLKMIVPTIATPATKGTVTVENIFKSYEEHFLDDSFEDVSTIGKYADIKATVSETKTEVLIELKEYSGKVPTSEVEKFWRDMERRSVRYGIFLSMRSGIMKISGPLKLETNLNRTAIFVVNSELNWFGHIFAYYIIKKIIEIEQIKKEEMKGTDLSTIVSRVNQCIIEIQQDMKNIDRIQEIADALKTTASNRLQEIIDLSNAYKKRVNDKINEAFKEIKRVDVPC